MTPPYSIVIPAHDAAGYLDRVLTAARAAEPAPQAIIVYDDASKDATAAIARAHGATLISGDSTSPVGPARARNAAAAHVETDFILFVDSDVIIEPDAPAKLLGEIETDPRIAASFGAYTARQATSNVAARYANLRHHYTHLHGSREAETFWTGLGAVRRSVFAKLEGFDRRIATPMMEDIELGFRLRQDGWRVRLVPEAQGVHLKNWTLQKLWRDDILTRAIPWSRMIAEGRGEASLNARSAERQRAFLALLTVAALAVSVIQPFALVAALVAAGAYIVSNGIFFRLLMKEGGIATGLAGPLLHLCYHLYSSTVFVATCAIVSGRQRLGAGKRALRRMLRAV